MSGAWSKGTNRAVAMAPPPGGMQTTSSTFGGRNNAGSRGRFSNSNNSNNNSNSNSNMGGRHDNYSGRGRGGSGGRGRGGGSGNVGGGGSGGGNRHHHHNNGRGRGGGRGGGRNHQNDNNNGPPPDRITIKDVQLLEETGLGQTPSQQKVIRINAREFVRQRLQYVEPCTNFQPHQQCQWTDENRIAEIQALCSRVMELGDVSKDRSGNNAKNNNKTSKHDTAPALEDCKPLEVNEEKRWKSKAMARKSTLVDESVAPPETTEEIVAKALLILNKVSWTTLDRLTAQFVDTTNLIENEPVRKEIIRLLVEKAQIEPHFGPMYAQICAIIAKQVKTFKKELLAVCQKEFEIDLDQKIQNATQGMTDPDEIEYHSTLIRKAYIGHMKFLGELYLRDVVKLSIMMYCLDELLKDKEHEDSLECFAQLMTTMGEKLDTHSKQNKKQFDWQQVIDLRHSTKLPNRTKFLLQDLLELRERGWVKRRKEETATTIADIHKEVAKEEQAKGSSSSRRASTTSAASLRRSTSLAATPQVDNDGFVSVSKGPIKKVHSKSNVGSGPPPSNTPLGKNTVQVSSLRRAQSQPGISSNNNDNVPTSPFDSKKIATKLGAGSSAPPPMPISEDNGAPTKSLVSPETCAKKMQSILKEYYVGGDTDDAVLSVDELVQAQVEEGAVERGAKVIEGATLFAMEGKPADVPKMLTVMTQCVQEGKIPNASIIKGWQDPLEFLGDIEIDAPLAGKHLARIIAECLKLNATTLDCLIEQSPEEFRKSGRAASFACQVLKERGNGEDHPPSDEELNVIEKLMIDDDKKDFDSGKAMWEAKK